MLHPPDLPSRALLRLRLELGRAAANEIAPNLHGWWCANLGRPLRLCPTD
ncbi:hypothetical protein [Deinococcus soli (ex Cha et al. 2016)]|uniref:Uncharacterized protein n=2 Tax=Deinococcus soli (ex Cha et al. 2016) TaxID=1309411 RepID=A0AAE3XC34_9DEIO|nr:hypothetical protein [Deinococcus soli (ex Cha et al. 2016)]MDR6217727.1 hypothetical protein [Deinococcus soli (ex Cha et al. 2016)]MDR6327977.1 hypothetical protein [Deinococcus soli (ex Cha et al. 2016)]MDR6750829.1 hypothetical protein [Deinococcus soli (ex Cha et al. 2016)]